MNDTSILIKYKKFSKLICYKIKEIVNATAVQPSSFECTWGVGGALSVLSTYMYSRSVRVALGYASSNPYASFMFSNLSRASIHNTIIARYTFTIC